MTKRIISSAILSLIANVLLPLAVVFLVGGMDALGILLLFIFILNPIVSVIIGILSSSDRVLWYLPVINAAVFLVAASIITGFDISYVIAAVIYVGLGLAAAYITSTVKNKKKADAPAE